MAPSLRVLTSVGLAVAWVMGGCHGRPLVVPRDGAWNAVANHDGAAGDDDGTWNGHARDGALDLPFETPSPEPCSQAGDKCCVGVEQATCNGKLACDPPTNRCVPCGGSGQPCCGPICDEHLTCDHSISKLDGVCTSACGRTDSACCHQGECEQGAACSAQDETGTCQSCGLVGLPCCRGDCWSGACPYTDPPRMCVACGQKGQPCCFGAYSTSPCATGTACDRPADQALGSCTDSCGTNGHACCRGGGCGSQLGCTTANESGMCRPCGGVGEPCCASGCRVGGTCARTPTGDLVCVGG